LPPSGGRLYSREAPSRGGRYEPNRLRCSRLPEKLGQPLSGGWNGLRCRPSSYFGPASRRPSARTTIRGPAATWISATNMAIQLMRLTYSHRLLLDDEAELDASDNLNCRGAGPARGWELGIPNPRLKLMDLLREVLQVKHYATWIGHVLTRFGSLNPEAALSLQPAPRSASPSVS
jgi:hypothetical protein